MDNSDYNSNQWSDMKIGILSETHEHTEHIKSAMTMLIGKNVDNILHFRN